MSSFIQLVKLSKKNIEKFVIEAAVLYILQNTSI